MNKIDNKKSEVAAREEQTLKFWQENRIFEKSLERPAPNGEFIFYDGPPFATGLPHYGHILPGTVKDIIPRYKTMRGYSVPRRWGWDCHGLPIENLVEKELGLETKKEIEKFGIEKFNERARASVLTYEREWKEIIPRTGRWIDMDHAYKTMDASYTESVWWSFKNLHEKGLIYQGWKSMHLCPRCETTLSNFEVSQNYKDITDISVYVKFELVDEPNTFLLAWTTTPWTLPGNVALAVNPNAKYGTYELRNQLGKTTKLIIGVDRFQQLIGTPDFPVSAFVVQNLGEAPTYLREWNCVGQSTRNGALLLGKKYRLPFPYYQNVGQVYAADFVSTEEGTGIVHIAPAFGEEDYQLSLRENLPLIQHVGTDGRFKPEVKDFAGELVKPKEDHQATDIKIIKYLAGRNLLFAKEKITHSYPHCWRCETPLLNYAASSWFLKVTDPELKNKIISENQKVKWLPEDIRDGRFGKWLEAARDWAISRSRYWGAPLPVWQCDKCEAQEVLGGLTDLKKVLPQSGNKYFLLRHGQSTANVANIIDCQDLEKSGLTEKGKTEVRDAGEKLSKKIDLIFASDFRRTRETAEMIAEKFNLNSRQIIYDQRLREIDAGDFNGRTWDDYDAYFADNYEHLAKSLPNGENVLAVKRRVMDFLSEINGKYQNKNILIVSHGLPLYMMWLGKDYLSRDEIVARDWQDHYSYTGELREVALVNLPHNADYELDLHRPYIDEVKWKCEKCESGTMTRVPEVFDTWYDSGAVPFAANNSRALKPADFIAEGLDQTRGWFYTLLVLSAALFSESPYKRVVVSGLVLAEDGKKMSKRFKNYPELTEVLDKYGADALRYYLMSSPAVRAEDIAFAEKGLDEVVKKLILRLENVMAFYELYKTEVTEKKEKNQTENILDRWILARLAELNTEVTNSLENYELDQAARPFALFVDDLSTWYLRRSRKRPEALEVLKKVLLELAKLLAPLMPFIAEEIYQKFRGNGDPESVHLASWPETEKQNSAEQILREMTAVRKLVSLGLEARAREGVKIRQPLPSLTVKNQVPAIYHEIIREELNVKKIILEADLDSELKLDLTLTPELKAEGEFRDLIRAVQDERKRLKLVPGQMAELLLNPVKKDLLEKNDNQSELQKVCSLSGINFSAECPTDSITLKV